MNLTRLQTFVEVVRNGTFAGAAEALTFTPSAVSQQMAKLEAELGAPLLVRDARGVRLTPAGKLLHARAQVILTAVRDAELDIDALRCDRSSRVRLGSFPAATAGVVPRALRLFRRRLPSIEVELLELGAQAVADGRVDLALESRLEAPDVDDDLGLTTVALAREPLSLAMPTSHPLAARDRLELEALDGLLIVGSVAMPEVAELMRRCAGVGAEPVLTGWRVPDPHALVQLAAAGEGLALVPALLADSAPPRTVLRPLEAGPHWELRALRPAGDVVPVTTLAMIEALRVAATLARSRPVPAVHAAA
jgi:DNA-binding transcriptional LysR family regulator